MAYEISLGEENDRHLFIVAGYPTLGKSSSLWKAARTGFPLFGSRNASIVPNAGALDGIRENSATEAKLQAGFWLTLSDISRLKNETHLPRHLILHLDLLLSFLRFRAGTDRKSDPTDLIAVFARLFAQPSLQAYRQATVVTLYAPLEEVRRRWRHRYPTGIPRDSSPILAAKDRLINDDRVAAPLFAAIYWGWEKYLEARSRDGLLAEHLQVESMLPTDPQPAPSFAETIPALRPSASNSAPARRSPG